MKNVLTKTKMNSNVFLEKSVCISKSSDTNSTSIEASRCTHCTRPMSSPFRTNGDRIKCLCIPCKRFLGQKEKEAWLALSKVPKVSEVADSSKPVDPCVETNDKILIVANKALASRLECPVCYQSMVPPLRQCRNGHSICCRCNARLNRCPTCRRSFIDTSNVLLNEICLTVAIPCRYYQDGCRQLVRLADKADHEKQCTWRKYDCPETVSGCVWKGSPAELVDHLSEEHSGSVSRIVAGQYTSLRYTYGRINPVEETNAEVDHFNLVSRSVLLVDESGEGRQVFVFSLKYDTVSGSLCAALRCVSSNGDASNYSYKVKLVSPDGNLKISTSTLCVCYEVSIDDIISSGRAMKVDGAVFKKFVNKEEKFYVSIKIFSRNDQTKGE